MQPFGAGFYALWLLYVFRTPPAYLACIRWESSEELHGSIQDLVEHWHETAADWHEFNSPSSCLSASSDAANSQQSANPHSCAAAAAAAAAAMAVVSTVHVPAGKAAAAVGAAAVLASHFTSVSAGSSISTPKRATSNCCVPPLEYEASAEQQERLENIAPTDFLCPLGRVLMTDPVFTPSGFTYHRPCIEEFILKTRKDPARDTPLDREQLLVNVNMRDQVAKWLQRHGVET